MFNEMASIEGRIRVMQGDDCSTRVSPENEPITVPNYESTIMLARLAMLVECEGSITIGMCPPSKTRNRPALAPAVDITNTAVGIIDEAKDTLTREGINFSVKRERCCAGVGAKRRFDLNIHGFDRVQMVLNALLPFLRSKRPQAELLLEFIRSRRCAVAKSAYSDREWEIVTDVRRMNKRQPNRKALAKAIAWLESPESATRPRAKEYFRKYVEMCTKLQEALKTSE
jgi:hypothetical protein